MTLILESNTGIGCPKKQICFSKIKILREFPDYNISKTTREKLWNTGLIQKSRIQYGLYWLNEIGKPWEIPSCALPSCRIYSVDSKQWTCLETSIISLTEIVY